MISSCVAKRKKTASPVCDSWASQEGSDSIIPGMAAWELGLLFKEPPTHSLHSPQKKDISTAQAHCDTASIPEVFGHSRVTGPQERNSSPLLAVPIFPLG